LGIVTAFLSSYFKKLKRMKHIQNLLDAQLDQPSIVTIGVFDGVHRGHQHLLIQLVRQAKFSQRQAVVLTLFPHPDRVLHGKVGRYYLTTPEQKAHLLGELGIDVVITHPFDEAVRQVRAADFVDQLINHLHMNSLWVTADFAMGYQREGNFAYLVAQGAEKGFEVQQIELLGDDGLEAVSSSAIREALLAGEVDKASGWLGRPYRVEGPVVHGNHRGRTIGIPTANIKVWDEQVIPANGVYACWAILGDERFMAMTNVGEAPTFDGKELRIEPHLLDFDRDIYGQTLAIEFVARLRGEQKFSGIDALVQQIRADIERGRAILTT
jgi:riboflavin kinase/FMN adenylyltransferase